eukprot:m.16341 g.16341  ORF g.16341 m.16341 type:complete len:130 (+) comp7055_c0_seq1:394-783(+)
MVQRLTFRRRLSYNTKSNRRTVVKTPGGKLAYQYTGKIPTVPKCGDCGIKLNGIKPARPAEYARMSKTKKTVSRTYGGSKCHVCVRSRILRAFLVEEQKMVKKVLQAKAKQDAEKAKKTATKSKKPKSK